MSVLKYLVPSGSLQESSLKYLYKGGFDVDEPDRTGYCGRNQAGTIEFVIRNRREIAHLVARGKYDAGLTGLDLLMNSRETGLRQIANLCFAKKTERPSRWVLAAKKNQSFSPDGKIRIGCELTNLPWITIPCCQFSPEHYDVVQLEGYEEMAIGDGRCDMILVVTETGRAIRECGLEVLPGCGNLLESYPTIIAKSDLPPEKEDALQEIRFAMENVIGAATRRMMKFDLPKAALSALQLPVEVAPTVADLAGREGWIAVEICIPRWQVPPIGLHVERAGGRAIVVQEMTGFSAGHMVS